jgi:hypothetical protein
MSLEHEKSLTPSCLFFLSRPKHRVSSSLGSLLPSYIPTPYARLGALFFPRDLDFHRHVITPALMLFRPALAPAESNTLKRKQAFQVDAEGGWEYTGKAWFLRGFDFKFLRGFNSIYLGRGVRGVSPLYKINKYLIIIIIRRGVQGDSP